MRISERELGIRLNGCATRMNAVIKIQEESCHENELDITFLFLFQEMANSLQTYFFFLMQGIENLKERKERICKVSSQLHASRLHVNPCHFNYVVFFVPASNL